MSLENVAETLLRSKEPSVRWKARVLVLGEDRGSRRIRELEAEIRRSPRVRALLLHANLPGIGGKPRDPYTKWQGAHWVLSTLADIGYPREEKALVPLRDRVLARWLGDGYYQEFEARTAAESYRKAGVPLMRGRYRRCASQQGNALYSSERLGFADDRSDALVERLLHWQWPDGGWNCDREPAADTSSFYESRHAMLALSRYADRTGARAARDAARRAAEVFLSRELFIGRRSGRVMNEDFVRLTYPLYYYYDILGALKAMTEIGRIRDPRCRRALDLLERKELPGGGWPAERRLYGVSKKSSTRVETRTESVDWGGARKTAMNPWITADALHVLRASGRM